MADEITCLIADDHEVVREGLRLALSRSPRIRVIGEATDGASAVALAERRRPDVVIMDLRMPDMDGLEATEQVLQRAPETGVLIFTAYGERSLLQRGLESGARGYILKEAPHETLLRAIEKVAAGETFVDPGLMAEFVAAPGPGGRPHAARARDPPAPRRRDVERGRRREALHQPGDREEPRAAHPREARSRHAHAGGRDRAPRGDDRLTVDDSERALLAERMLAEQEERRRVAELLHDGPIQQLSAISQMLDAGLADLASGDDRAAVEVFSRGLELARDAARDLRALCDDLEPRVLHQLGFASAAAALARRIASRHEVEIDLDVEHADELGENAAVALYQILREATEQAVKRGPLDADRDLAARHRGRRRRARRRRRRAARAAAAVLEALAERAATLNGRFSSEVRYPRGSTRPDRRAARNRPPLGIVRIAAWKETAGAASSSSSGRPSGYTLIERSGDPPRPGTEVEDGDAALPRDEDRAVAAPGRSAPCAYLQPA